MDALQSQIAFRRSRAEALCRALRHKAASLFGEDPIPGCTVEAASFRVGRDPASGADALVGEWHDDQDRRLGMLVFNGDGSCFAEFDIVRMHPEDSRWFVEAVEAWAGAHEGPDGGGVRADFRFLAMP
jgi:hypothetical protein